MFTDEQINAYLRGIYCGAQVDIEQLLQRTKLYYRKYRNESYPNTFPDSLDLLDDTAFKLAFDEAFETITNNRISNLSMCY